MNSVKLGNKSGNRSGAFSRVRWPRTRLALWEKGSEQSCQSGKRVVGFSLAHGDAAKPRKLPCLVLTHSPDPCADHGEGEVRRCFVINPKVYSLVVLAGQIHLGRFKLIPQVLYKDTKWLFLQSCSRREVCSGSCDVIE